MNVGARDTILPDSRPAVRWLRPMITAALIGAFLLQVMPNLSDMSATVDEPVYIESGYSYWATRDGRLNVEHTPLLKLLIALPLLPLHLTVPTETRAWREENEYGLIWPFLHRNRAHWDEILLRSRLPIVLLGVLLAVFVQKWAAELWGADAGLIALLMFVFEPNILAQSGLATLDLGFTAFTFIAMYYVWKWLRSGRRAYAVSACVAFGCSWLSKGPAPAFLPIFLLVLVVDHIAASRSGAPRYVAPVKGFLQLLGAATVLVIAVYAVTFHWHPLVRAGEHHTMDKALARIPGLRGRENQLIAAGQRIWVPAVSYYVEGMRFNQLYALGGHPAFLLGRHSLHGWWYFYPVVFLLKTPLPILLLILFRLFRLKSVPLVADEYVVVLPVIGVMALACFSTLDIGLRYILPLYPFVFVWLSRVVALELFPNGPKPHRDRADPCRPVVPLARPFETAIPPNRLVERC